MRVFALAEHLADAARVYRSTGDKATLQATFHFKLIKSLHAAHKKLACYQDEQAENLRKSGFCRFIQVSLIDIFAGLRYNIFII